MCALLDGRSVETTMGFGGLSGLPMATRSGDVPPDLLFWLLRRKPAEAAALETALYQRSGLLGLSGTSGDMRVLQDSKDPRAEAAVEFFVYALTKYAGAYVGCTRRVGCAGVHGGHWRAFGSGARGAVPQSGMAECQAGRSGERSGRATDLHAR